MRAKVLIAVMLYCTLTACDPNTKDARRFIRVAERMVDTHPDSTLLLIDSVMRMEARLSDREHMEMALLQGNALYGGSLCHDEKRSIPVTMVPLPELDYAAEYYYEKGAYSKAASAALYKGYSSFEADDKAGAMQSFKAAEQYGNETGDSLTVARAQYWIGKILYDDGNKEEALAMLSQADQAFGDHYAERAMTQNVMAAVHILLSDFVSAEECLKQALNYAEIGGCNEARRKALNNYAVIYRILGKYEEALGCLRQIYYQSDSTQLPLVYINMGGVFFSSGVQDSAAFYYDLLEKALPNATMKDMTKVSAYGALSRYAENRGDYQKSLEYRSQYDKYLSNVYDERIQNNVYATEKRYDYERIRQNADHEMIRNQRIVSSLVALLMVLVLATLFIYFRLIQKKLKEAETKALLLKMLNQNSNLLKDNEDKKEENHQLTETITTLLAKRLKAMQKLDVFMKDRKNSTSLTDLEKLVFDGNDHIEMMMQVIEVMHPGLYQEISENHPDFSDLEKKVCLLSRFKLSRYEEAKILGVSTSVLDKIRGKVRKKAPDYLDFNG